MWDRLEELWCKAMHDRAMWPIHGSYHCSQCMREYRVEWATPPRTAEYADASLRPNPQTATASI
jgi:hypothetical protein